nr:LysE family translocator [Larsenimonas suaedae]
MFDVLSVDSNKECCVSFVLSAVLVNLPLAFSPGPANLLCVGVAASKGFRRTLPFIGGLQVLPLVYSVLVAMGASAVLSRLEQLSDMIKLLGSLYMMWLAFRMWRAPRTPAQNEAEASPAVASGFWQGVAAQAANPKNILIVVTLYSVFAEQSQSLGAGLALAVIITLCNLASHLCWSLGASTLRASPRLARYQNRLSGGLLVVAVALLWL